MSEALSIRGNILHANLTRDAMQEMKSVILMKASPSYYYKLLSYNMQSWKPSGTARQSCGNALSVAAGLDAVNVIERRAVLRAEVAAILHFLAQPREAVHLCTVCRMPCEIARRG